jgi:hypothetical protein
MAKGDRGAAVVAGAGVAGVRGGVLGVEGEEEIPAYRERYLRGHYQA